MNSPQRYRPFSGGYVSEMDQFLSKLLSERPDIVEDRQRGWYIWWDHRVDLDELDKQHRNEIPAKPYQYD